MGLPPDHLDFKGMTCHLEDWLDKEPIRDKIEDAKPWWLKAHNRSYLFLFGWNGLINHKLNPKENYRKLKWYHQRGKRGWADYDVWSTDSYISKVLAEMLAYLADNNHAWPGEGSPWKSPDDWSTHLRDLSARLMEWNKDEGYLDETAYNTTAQAMEEFGKNLGYYWD